MKGQWGTPQITLKVVIEMLAIGKPEAGRHFLDLKACGKQLCRVPNAQLIKPALRRFPKTFDEVPA